MLNAIYTFNLSLQLITFGPQAFVVAGPEVWDAPPLSLRDPTLSFDCYPGRL